MKKSQKTGTDFVSRLSEKVSITVDKFLCKGCGICIEFCPTKVYVWSNDITKMGFKYPIPKNVDKCTFCKLCELMCPDFAISVEKR